MRNADIHSDNLERIGDMLPTPEEMAELNAYHDQCERDFMRRQLADADRLDTVPANRQGYGFGYGL